MKYIYLLPLISTLSFGLDCNIHLNITKPTSSQIKVTISHDKNCTLTIEDLNRTIVITSDTNETIKEERNITIISNMLTLAKSKIGTPYKSGRTGPDSFDCSGFIYYLFRENNISIPRTSLNQSKIAKPLSRDEIEVGDILSFDTTHVGHINHSGLYIGDGEFIHASSGRAYGVTISKLDKGFYKDKFRWGVRVDSGSKE